MSYDKLENPCKLLEKYSILRYNDKDKSIEGDALWQKKRNSLNKLLTST